VTVHNHFNSIQFYPDVQSQNSTTHEIYTKTKGQNTKQVITNTIQFINPLTPN